MASSSTSLATVSQIQRSRFIQPKRLYMRWSGERWISGQAGDHAWQDRDRGQGRSSLAGLRVAVHDPSQDSILAKEDPVIRPEARNTFLTTLVSESHCCSTALRHPGRLVKPEQQGLWIRTYNSLHQEVSPESYFQTSNNSPSELCSMNEYSTTWNRICAQGASHRLPREEFCFSPDPKPRYIGTHSHR